MMTFIAQDICYELNFSLLTYIQTQCDKSLIEKLKIIMHVLELTQGIIFSVGKILF